MRNASNGGMTRKECPIWALKLGAWMTGEECPIWGNTSNGVHD